MTDLPATPVGTRRDRAVVRNLWAWSLTVGVLAGIVFTMFPDVDLRASRHFLMSDGVFAGTRHDTAKLARYGLLGFFWVCVGVAIAGMLLTCLRANPWLNLQFAQWMFVTICLAVGPGLVANTMLKDHWGRARPNQLIEFGGKSMFTLPLAPSDQCMRDCSFVSGEASSIFMPFYAGALVAPQLSAVLLATGTVAGLIAGGIRVSQGGHFVSDIVFAGVFMLLTALVLHELIFGAPWLRNLLKRLLRPLRLT
jgi:lipid A 4'-phosphatase